MPNAEGGGAVDDPGLADDATATRCCAHCRSWKGGRSNSSSLPCRGWTVRTVGAAPTPPGPGGGPVTEPQRQCVLVSQTATTSASLSAFSGAHTCWLCALVSAPPPPLPFPSACCCRVFAGRLCLVLAVFEFAVAWWWQVTPWVRTEPPSVSTPMTTAPTWWRWIGTCRPPSAAARSIPAATTPSRPTSPAGRATAAVASFFWRTL
jgi:hypothetical protein